MPVWPSWSTRCGRRRAGWWQTPRVLVAMQLLSSASGHSAGGHLASYLAARAPHETQPPEIPVKSLLLVSGLYDLRPITTSYLQPSLSLTDEEVASFSPLGARADGGTRGGGGGSATTRPSRSNCRPQDLCFAAAQRGLDYQRITLPELDHMTIVRDLGRPESRMGGPAGRDHRRVAGVGCGTTTGPTGWCAKIPPTLSLPRKGGGDQTLTPELASPLPLARRGQGWGYSSRPDLSPVRVRQTSISNTSSPFTPPSSAATSRVPASLCLLSTR